QSRWRRDIKLWFVYECDVEFSHRLVCFVLTCENDQQNETPTGRRTRGAFRPSTGRGTSHRNSGSIKDKKEVRFLTASPASIKLTKCVISDIPPGWDARSKRV